jgi:hypothetical protein
VGTNVVLILYPNGMDESKLLAALYYEPLPERVGGMVIFFGYLTRDLKKRDSGRLVSLNQSVTEV